MATAATGQKLDRLPAGKIFGMAITAPNVQISQSEEQKKITQEFESQKSPEEPMTDVNSTDVTICNDFLIFYTLKKFTFNYFLLFRELRAKIHLN